MEPCERTLTNYVSPVSPDDHKHTATTDTRDEAERVGRELYQSNANYRLLANVMEHPEFRDFYDTFLADKHKREVALMFMNLYAELENKSLETMTGYQKIAIVDKLVKHPGVRRAICHSSLPTLTQDNCPR